MVVKQLNKLGQDIFDLKYKYPGDKSWSDRAKTIAKHIASAEKSEDVSKWEKRFFDVIGSGDFVPGGRIIFGAGRPGQNLLNCYGIEFSDNIQSIASVLGNMYKISCGGGGIGFAISKIRPKGDDIQNMKHSAPGSVSVLKMINEVGEHVRAGGARRTALLAVLNVDHPDLLEFLSVKLDKKQLNNFNISVGITEKFLKACENDEDWNFFFNNKKYFIYQLDRISQLGNDVVHIPSTDAEDALGRASLHYKKHFSDTFDNPIKIEYKAKDLWNQIWKNSVETGCPGIFNVDLVNKYHNVSYFEYIATPNPCTAKGTLVNTPTGYRKVEDIQVGDKVCTLIGSEPVAKIEKHLSVPVFRVKFSDGGEQIVTAAHRYHVLNGKKIEKLRLDEIGVGSFVQVFPCKLEEDKSVGLDYLDGVRCGVLLGDGSVTQPKAYKISVNSDESNYIQGLRNLFEDNLGGLIIGKNSKSGLLNVETKYSEFLSEKYGIACVEGHEKRIPEKFLKSKDTIVGVIDGLIATDGNIALRTDFPMIRITTTSFGMAQDMRRALLYLGIHGRVYSSFYDDGGTINGRKISRKFVRYDVHIFGSGFRTYYELTKLKELNSDKWAKIYEGATQFALTGGTWKTEIISIEPHGYSEVYDLFCAESDSWITEGYVQQGCGEVPLPNYGNCCLGHINLSQMIDKEKNDVDWRRLAQTVRVGIRFLDNVLTINPFPIEECKEVGHRSRRIGLGTTGLHYMLIELGIKYGSEKCIEFLERLYTTIRNEAYLTSMYIAEEKGSFPAFDAEKYLAEEFAKTLPARIRMLIRRNGIRNAVMLTCAPCGTISMVMGCSTGLEPIFSPIYLRRYREGNVWKEVPVIDPLFKEYVSNGKSIEELKELFVGAYDVTPQQHMAVQATIQKFIDLSLSKTINLPSTAKAEDFAEMALAYAPYLKGMTVYRAASKENEPLSIIPLTQENLDLYLKPELEAEVTPAACSIEGGECGA